MPLTDLVRFLNARVDDTPHSAHFNPRFLANEAGAHVHFAGLRLESEFHPIIQTDSGHLHGHAAALRVTSLRSLSPVAPESVFILPSDDGEFVQLDRLVRTLHVLNYLTRRARGRLLLKVHQRHVMSVPSGHGLAFEELLRQCGLVPEQVALEIDISGSRDISHLKRAVATYRSRGYGIGIADFGRGRADFKLLSALQPDLVKLDSRLTASLHALQQPIARIHELGARPMIVGINTPALRKEAATAHIPLLQSELLPSHDILQESRRKFVAAWHNEAPKSTPTASTTS